MYDYGTPAPVVLSPSVMLWTTVGALIVALILGSLMVKVLYRVEQRARLRRHNPAEGWDQVKVDEELDGIVEATVRSL